MHIYAKNSVLLQTSRVQMKPPQEEQISAVWLILDSGSQMSCVTREIKDAVGNFVTCSTRPQFSAIYCIISLAFDLEDTVQSQVHSSEIEVTN